MKGKTVRRPTVLIITLVLLAAGGCTNFLTETNPPEPWSQSRYEDAYQANKERLRGEDDTPTTFGDVVFYLPNQLGNGIAWIYNVSTGHTAVKYAKELFHRNPDIRRNAVYTLSDQPYGRRPPYTDYYAHMAKTDQDPTVRMAALRALNRARAANQTEAMIADLNDDNWWVRLEAAKAIANIPDPKAIPGLMRLLNDEQQNRDVRIACADGLRCYQQSDVAQALIRVLSDRDYGVARQAQQSLNLMTSKDFGLEPSPWLNYLTSTPKPFAASTTAK